MLLGSYVTHTAPFDRIPSDGIHSRDHRRRHRRRLISTFHAFSDRVSHKISLGLHKNRPPINHEWNSADVCNVCTPLSDSRRDSLRLSSELRPARKINRLSLSTLSTHRAPVHLISTCFRVYQRYETNWTAHFHLRALVHIPRSGWRLTLCLPSNQRRLPSSFVTAVLTCENLRTIKLNYLIQLIFQLTYFYFRQSPGNAKNSPSLFETSSPFSIRIYILTSVRYNLIYMLRSMLN